MTNDTNSRSARLLTAIGLEPDAPFDEVLSVPAPAEAIAHGLMANTSVKSGELDPALLGLIAKHPSWSPLREFADEDRLPDTVREAFRWTSDAGIVGFDSSALQWGGAAGLLDDGRSVLDTRHDLAWVRIAGDEDADFVVAGEHGQLVVYRQPVAPFELAPPPDTNIEVPDAAALLAGGYQIDSWLSEQAESLSASDDFVLKTSAVGMLARFAVLATPDTGAWHRAIMEGLPTPATRMREWARGLDDVARDLLQTHLVDECGDLAGDLVVLPQLVSEAVVDLEARADLGMVLRSLCQRRDALESLQAVLDAADVRDTRENLDGLDQVAGGLRTTFDIIEVWTESGIYDRQLELAMLDVPDAWWGPSPE